MAAAGALGRTPASSISPARSACPPRCSHRRRHRRLGGRVPSCRNRKKSPPRHGRCPGAHCRRRTPSFGRSRMSHRSSSDGPTTPGPHGRSASQPCWQRRPRVSFAARAPCSRPATRRRQRAVGDHSARPGQRVLAFAAGPCARVASGLIPTCPAGTSARSMRHGEHDRRSPEDSGVVGAAGAVGDGARPRSRPCTGGAGGAGVRHGSTAAPGSGRC